MSMHLELEPQPLSSPRVVNGAAPADLSSRQKAALIVRLLLSQDVSPGLDRLSVEHQARMTRAMGTLGPVNRATLAAVVAEFTGRLDNIAMTAPRDLPSAIELMEPHISPLATEDLQAEVASGEVGDAWSVLAKTDTEELKPLLLSESAEVCAILLSKLGVAKAAALLADLPRERAEIIAHGVALTATVTPDMVMRIGEYLQAQVEDVPAVAFRATPVDRVGAILNAVPTAARDGLLEGLSARDTAFADDVRRAIFTFHHIPKRISATDVPRIAREVDNDTLITALAAGMQAAPDSVEFLLGNMSKRMAEQLRDEAQNLATPREDEGEAAMADVVSAIRTLEEAGEIRVLQPDS